MLALYERLEEGVNCALATVIETEGPSYRSAGAQSLVTDDGLFRGGLSAGCLEGDVACRLDGASSSFIVQYDLSAADEIRGFPFGCGGTVKVLVEPLSTGSGAIDSLRWLVANRQQAALITVLPGNDINHPRMTAGARFGITQSGCSFNFDGLSSAESIELSEILRRALGQKSSAVQEVTIANLALSVFVQYYKPVITVTIYGDSEDAQVLRHLAETVGYQVNLLSKSDVRAGKFSCDPSQFCVVMTHDLDCDTLVVNYMLTAAAPEYLGILGPKTRTEKMLTALGFNSNEVLTDTCVFAPAGLNIGAETPAEIALSIVAELQAVSRRCRPDHLRDKAGAIHDRSVTAKKGVIPLV